MELRSAVLIAALFVNPQSARAVHRAPLLLRVNAGTMPAGGTSHVHLVVETRDGVRPVVRLINKAQRSIFVSVYILTDHAIVHALDRAASEGDGVYVLLEHHPYGMGTQPDAMAASLRAAGIHVRWSSQRFTYAHAKYLVLDDRTVLIGTANLSASAFSNNREFIAVDARRTDVRAVSSLFRADWDGLPAVVSDPELVVAPLGARSQIEGLAAGATKTIDIYAEEVTDPRMEHELVSLSGRGVQVRVLLPPGATVEGARHLARGGVLVRTLASPYIHAKALLVDGREGFVGSENISSTSLDHNRELGLLIRGRPLQTVGSYFSRDWKRATPLH